MSVVALTRAVSPLLGECELTYLDRASIDVGRATEQHAGYEVLLRQLGATVVRVLPAPRAPDSVFIEDTAIVLPEVAVVTRPGAASRRVESAGVAEALRQYRALKSLHAPATLDGGDVVQVGRTLYVGRSSRSNAAGAEQLQALAGPHGYTVVPVDFSGCLHLKSAVTVVADGVILHNPAWVSRTAFAGCDSIATDDIEPHGANGLRVGEHVIYAAQFPRTRERLEQHGLQVASVDCSELAKAEGAVTCCSLVFDDPTPRAADGG